jgi:hypothetical protein
MTAHADEQLIYDKDGACGHLLGRTDSVELVRLELAEGATSCLHGPRGGARATGAENDASRGG